MNNFKILNTKNINFQITNVNRINFRKDINGTLYYYDESHLAKDGAELVGLEIVKTIKDLD